MGIVSSTVGNWQVDESEAKKQVKTVWLKLYVLLSSQVRSFILGNFCDDNREMKSLLLGMSTLDDTIS